MTRLASRPLAPISLRELHDVDPYPAYEAMRAVGPVVWDAAMGAWLVLSHDGCAFVERREDLFEEPTGTLPGAAEIVGQRDFRSLVGEQHELLHRSLSHAWRPDPIAPMAVAAVRPLVADRLAGLAPRDGFELFGDFARLLPIAVIGRVLGLPDADAQALDRAKGWMEAVLAWRHSYGEDPAARARAVEATRLLEPALLDTVRERRDHPRDDAISFLWSKGREVAPDWGEQDVLDNAKFLFEAGSETTAFLVCNAVHRLLELTPEARAAALADREPFAHFIEEVLRHTTVIHLRARRATADVELGGVSMRAGERVIAINAAANRDPDHWERPSVFDPERPRLFGHLAFNVGPRHCVGAHLARMEAMEAIGGMWRAFPDLARTEAGPGIAEVQATGFVSRAWRPIELRHAPVAPDEARSRVLVSPEPAPRSTAGYGTPHPG
ncbi:MAG: cytochrome P450 [Chloroflexota bacterium]